MSTTVFLVRHAKAGKREEWEGDDRMRPLSKTGRKQAEGLVELFGEGEIDRVVSSPYDRCTQTVEPLASAFELHLETDDGLAEGANLGDTFKLINGATTNIVLCSHGDVIFNVVCALAETGTPGVDGMRCKKGSTWVFEVQDGTVTTARYVPPA